MPVQISLFMDWTCFKTKLLFFWAPAKHKHLLSLNFNHKLQMYYVSHSAAYLEALYIMGAYVNLLKPDTVLM